MKSTTNDITGDSIKNTKGSASKYAEGYDLIDWSVGKEKPKPDDEDTTPKEKDK